MEKQAVTSKTLFDFAYVSNPRFNADGTQLAFTLMRADEKENTYKGDIYLYRDGKSIPLTAGGDAKGFVWSKRDTLLFSALRDKDDKAFAEKGEPRSIYYEIATTGGEAQKLFSLDMEITKVLPLTATTYLLAAVMDHSEKKPEGEKGKVADFDVLTEVPFWWNGGGFSSGRRTRLYLYDVEKGEPTPITGEWFDVQSVETDGELIVYTGQEWRDMPSRKDGVYLYDLSSKETLCLLEPNKLYVEAAYPFERSVLVVSTDGRVYGDDRYPDFYTVPVTGGKLTLLKEYEACVGDGSVGSDARLGGGIVHKVFAGKLYFVSTVNDTTLLYSIDEAGVIRTESQRLGSVDSFDVSEKGIVLCAMYGNHPAELYKGEEQLTHFNDALVDTLTLSTPVMHTYRGSDAVTIHGWAMPPVGYKPGDGKKYPAILHIHGGPRTTFADILHHEMQLWANNGYFVFYCNPRGSDGRGNEFGDLCGKYGSVDYMNLMEFMDEMLKLYADAVDEKRVGVGGGSYGGYMTNWIIGHTDRFAAAVSQRSIANWVSFEHTTDIGTFFTDSQHGATTRTDVQKLWDLSPLKYAPNAKTPTLFIHSDRDYRCWMAEGLTMFTALKMNHCEARLCLFHGETHELSRSGKPQNRVKRMDEILAWFDKYLK